jgi:hypothetical protein
VLHGPAREQGPESSSGVQKACGATSSTCRFSSGGACLHDHEVPRRDVCRALRDDGYRVGLVREEDVRAVPHMRCPP